MGQNSLHCHPEIFVIIITWCMYVCVGRFKKKKQLYGISSVLQHGCILGIKLRSLANPLSHLLTTSEILVFFREQEIVLYLILVSLSHRKEISRRYESKHQFKNVSFRLSYSYILFPILQITIKLYLNR